MEAVRDLVVEDVETGFCGAVVRVEKTPGGYTVTLEDRHGKHRVFPLGPGFWFEGRPATLIRPKAAAPAESKSGRDRTASGSVAVHGLRAKVAKAGRIYVEGKHDAELVERVWGDDLRIEGVVVPEGRTAAVRRSPACWHSFTRSARFRKTSVRRAPDPWSTLTLW